MYTLNTPKWTINSTLNLYKNSLFTRCTITSYFYCINITSICKSVHSKFRFYSLRNRYLLYVTHLHRTSRSNCIIFIELSIKFDFHSADIYNTISPLTLKKVFNTLFSFWKVYKTRNQSYDYCSIILPVGIAKCTLSWVNLVLKLERLQCF